jgi:hypothetical protein
VQKGASSKELELASAAAAAAEVGGEEEAEVPYKWGGPILQDINLSIKKGEFVMVTGRVGRSVQVRSSEPN